MLSEPAIDTVVRAALDEDAPWGDLTSQVLIPADAVQSARLIAREPGVFSGGAVFESAFRLTDARIAVKLLAADGARFETGDVLAAVSGPAHGILQAERIGLNFVQRMSGVATLTARYVAETVGTNARIVDTRKTTPGLRALERQAVRDGGGHNHRFGLSDAVLAKDNHLAVLGAGTFGAGELGLTEALRQVRDRLSHTTHFEVEVDRIDQIEPVLAAGIDTIMLDNFTPEELREGVRIVAGRAIVEASGGVSLQTVRAIAESGVDIISVGALTHSVRSLDLGLDVIIDAEADLPQS